MSNPVVNRKTIVTTVAVILLGFCLQGMSCSPPVDSPPVDIPDPNLRTQIERALRRKSGARITEADMANLTKIDRLYTTTAIRDLTGLEFATNLKTLGLYDNSISDISPLSGLTSLKVLALKDSELSDISVLAGLTKLKALDLNFNEVSDISVLAEFNQTDRTQSLG